MVLGRVRAGPRDAPRRRTPRRCEASDQQLAGLPPALVIVDECDVLRDEGEAYAARLRTNGVDVTTVRYDGTIHDFMMLNPLSADPGDACRHRPGHRDPARGTAMIRLALAGLISAALVLNAADASARTPPPTIVFVHGAFADASGFDAVTDRLQARGYPVFAPANPLRGLASDAAYVASAIAPIKGPIVLVGHSYGGAVISQPALALPNVKALVYVDGNAVDEGESVLDIAQRFPGKLGDALVPRPFAGGVDLYIDPASFHSVFAADLSARAAARMVTAQRPVTQDALEEKSAVPNWRSLPSWYLVGTADQAIPVAAQRFMAKRAKATTVEVRASHVSYLSHPNEVAALIVRAARGR